MYKNLIALLLLVVWVSAPAQGVSDRQLSRYVREAHEAGKSQSQIEADLRSMGLSAYQIEILDRDIYAAERSEDRNTGSRSRISRNDNSGRIAAADSLRRINRGVGEMRVFGREIFNQELLSFEPNMNLATPSNYKLGPGDEVIIDIWGASENNIRQTISPDGNIFINGLGQVFLSGLTVEEANVRLRKQFGRMYSGIGGSSQVKLSLGQIRTIQVNVMGEVVVPGTYALSSFASVFHALYSAGGVNDIGTLRDIRLVRDGEVIARIDIYDYLINGAQSDFIRLEEGDVVLVPTFESLVEISGGVKRPMYYEMKDAEDVQTLIYYAGGFSADAYSRNLTLSRFTGTEREIFTVDAGSYRGFTLKDGDKVYVGNVNDRFENRLRVEGAVNREGYYQLDESVNTVRKLINKAEGLRGDAFLDRAIISRERSDYSMEILPVDLRGILNGTADDVALKNGDKLFIPSIFDLQEEVNVSIHGEVANPGIYAWGWNMTVEDLVVLAGGLLESASTVRVDVARRLKDTKSTEEGNAISQIVTLSLKDNLDMEGWSGFSLMPYDEVYIRRSPGYQTQRNVLVTGEVLFPGTYALTQKSERISDILTRTGGLTSDAYIQGARILRKMNDDEAAMMRSAMKVAAKGGKDSISMESLDNEQYYNVGIRMDKALSRPGSNYDLILREGDRIVIPEYAGTVRINGEVLHTNTVVYKSNRGVKYYVNQAGGYTSSAKKSKVYVTHMNGTVSRKKGRKAIEPGCEIIVPSKSERRRMSMAEILSLTTSAASLGTMGASIANLAK